MSTLLAEILSNELKLGDVGSMPACAIFQDERQQLPHVYPAEGLFTICELTFC